MLHEYAILKMNAEITLCFKNSFCRKNRVATTCRGKHFPLRRKQNHAPPLSLVKWMVPYLDCFLLPMQPVIQIFLIPFEKVDFALCCVPTQYLYLVIMLVL